MTLDAGQIGTPHYMSPEQARAEPCDAASDQYSLGVVLYELATGVLPRDHANPLQLLKMVAEEGFPPSQHDPTIDPALQRIILRCMAAEPAQRYGDLRDVLAALLPFAAPTVAAVWSHELATRGAALPSASRARAPSQPRDSAAPLVSGVRAKLPEPPAPVSGTSAGTRLALVLGVALVTALGAAAWWVHERAVPPAPPAPTSAAIERQAPQAAQTRVTITSEPPGASVESQGLLLGRTPLTQPIVRTAAGETRRFQITLRGHAPEHVDCAIRGDAMSVAVQLDPASSVAPSSVAVPVVEPRDATSRRRRARPNRPSERAPRAADSVEVDRSPPAPTLVADPVVPIVE